MLCSIVLCKRCYRKALRKTSLGLLLLTITVYTLCYQHLLTNNFFERVGLLNPLLNSTRRVALVTVCDEHYISTRKIQINLQRLNCYALRHKYSFIQLDPKEVQRTFPRCATINDVGFVRHCMISNLLERFDWIFALDADQLPVNFDQNLDQFIMDNLASDIVFYERFRNNEIASASYLVRSTNWTKLFLDEWAKSVNTLLPTHEGVFSNYDNGAVHMLVLKEIFPNKMSLHKRCYELWNNSYDVDSYDMYVDCVKTAIGPPRRWPHITILHRGHGWALDTDILDGKFGASIIFLHGVKFEVIESLLPMKANSTPSIDRKICQSLNFTMINRKLTDAEFAEQLKSSDIQFRFQRINAFRNHYIQSCLPYCKPIAAANAR